MVLFSNTIRSNPFDFTFKVINLTYLFYSFAGTQFLYTTLFGAFTAFIFMRTGER